MKIIPSDAVVQRKKNIISSDIDGETVMMSIDKGKYYGTDPVGSRIWSLLEEPISIVDLCNKLIDEYNVGIAECTKDVMTLLEQLDEEDLIKVVDAKDL